VIGKGIGLWLAGLLLAALPTSTNYNLNSYGFGSGGTANSTSTNYRANGLTGEVSGSSSSTNYKAATGENHVKEANVPTVTIANNASWYNKLLVTIGPENNPNDAKFAVAISADNFATTQYIKSDFTIGSTLALTDYQTYAAWGSGSGVFVRGLAAGTVYTVKAKAFHGAFTESAYGPTTNAATVNPQLSFDIDVSATDQSTSPPYAIDFGNLLPSTVVDSPQRVWVSLDTNGESGGKVYLSGQNGGLRSATTAYTISALSGDLGAAAEGFGVQEASAAQTSGGPFAPASPYNVTGTNVGIADAAIRDIFTAATPVTGGRGSFILKAKSKPLTPSSSDYAELLTAIASASF